MSHPTYPTSAEPMSEAIREHLRLSRSAGFMLYGQMTGCYVAVNTNLERMASIVKDQLEWNVRNGRPPDVMADSAEIVNDFMQTFPPKGG